MNPFSDGPQSPLFTAVPLAGTLTLDDLPKEEVSEEMQELLPFAPRGNCTFWGIPFHIDRILLLKDDPIAIQFPPTLAKWLVFCHTSDLYPLAVNQYGFHSPMRGEGGLAEKAATYTILYQDGSQSPAILRRRFQIGAFTHRWGERCVESVPHHKPFPLNAPESINHFGWGFTQTRATGGDFDLRWTNWLWAWQNPYPQKPIAGVRFEPTGQIVLVMAIAAGNVQSNPLRWLPRQKARLTLPKDVPFQNKLDEHGLLAQVQLDLGQVISATRQPIYPNEKWEDSYNNQLPVLPANQILLEYTCHPQANFHLWNKAVIPVSSLESRMCTELQPVAPARQRVRLRVVERDSNQLTAVKLHIHGEAGEYLTPRDRHRIPNANWFEDYSVDFTHQGIHHSTYIPGSALLDLPLGKVYVEISKGFEIRPIRKVIEITPQTEEIVFEIDKVLPWRERNWVTADTHVHFLSPMSAMLEGAGEGVNVVNLLASQWGELMTNVGDFDGKTTWGSKEAGGDGEFLVRVGTENRQHVLGHISLLGYRGDIILPLTTGGADESAIGDPVEVLLTEWARQCKAQGGVVVLPHFPNPRLEHAASIVSGQIDAIEMTSWGDLYAGIDPYSLSDWYRSLNCGYLLPAVGGTDKMSANTAVGTVRTYAHLRPTEPFTYEAWMDAIRRAETFVTYGPLIEFNVEGKPMGSRIALSANGGTLDIHWQVASVTVPVTRVELIVNGEIRQSAAIDKAEASGYWSQRIEKSSWLALLVRGHYPDQPEIVAAHSSPVMVMVEGSQMLPAADALTILEQIEGALAFLDTLATKAEEKAYKRMRLELQSAYRAIHNRMHEAGYFHDHPAPTDHAEHHG